MTRKRFVSETCGR